MDEKKQQGTGQADVEDERLVPGASATLSNVGPDRPQLPVDPDVISGTTSGERLRKKPEKGSRTDVD